MTQHDEIQAIADDAIRRIREVAERERPRLERGQWYRHLVTGGVYLGTDDEKQPLVGVPLGICFGPTSQAIPYLWPITQAEALRLLGGESQ